MLMNVSGWLIFSFFLISLIFMILVGAIQLIKVLRKQWKYSERQFIYSLESRNRLKYMMIIAFIVILGYLWVVMRYLKNLYGQIFFGLFGVSILFVIWSTYFYHKEYCRWYVNERRQMSEEKT